MINLNLSSLSLDSDPKYAGSRSNIQKIIAQTEDLNSKKHGLSEQRLSGQIQNLRKMIAFFRQYPDLFVDFIKGQGCSFKFYFYQRVFLREVMRHRYVYATFPRAYSKSFLSMMALMIRCILFPNSQLFVTTGGKQQAASITVAKIQEICKLIPALANEIDWSRGVSKKSRDNVNYVFKNGSCINILAAKESSRGQRRTGRKNFLLLWSNANKNYLLIFIFICQDKYKN